MARKRKHEEHENHERWLISYADFITLLFAFFVVMYSVSSINEGKYRVLSESLDAAFRSPNRSIVPIQIGDISKAPKVSKIAVTPPVVRVGLANMPAPRFQEGKQSGSSSKQSYAGGGDSAHRMEDISKKLNKAMAPLVEKGLLDISKNKKWVKVNINSNILFGSGSASLSRQALPILESIAGILKPLDVSIHVEGFTDNVPISNLIFPSNWELSAARAASVVHLFAKNGINPKRMAAVGYGEFHPVADNNSVAGRQKNRRVVLIINSAKSPRFEEQEQVKPQNQQAPENENKVTVKASVAESAKSKPKYKPETKASRRSVPSTPSFIELPKLPSNINR